ncbi:MAG: GNAT family N-acetyltransferase [Pseudomonadota bacterium]
MSVRFITTGQVRSAAMDRDAAVTPRRVVVRRAAAEDVKAIAKLAYLAGGEMFTFLLRELDPAADPLRVHRELIAAPDGMPSYRNCLVAVSRGQIVGTANAFPARLIAAGAGSAPPTEREMFLRPRTALNDPDSYFLNDIAVTRSHRRCGIGEALLQGVIDEARRHSFPSLTLHVWADNTGAIALYRRVGFEDAGHAEIPWHPELRHTGGSLLLRLSLAPDAAGD